MAESREIYLQVADAIGARLCRDALWAGDRCNWLGASMEPVGGAWKIAERTFGPDLYAGTSGIALFLGQLYASVGERIYRMTALGAVRQAFSRLEDIPPANRASLYSGLLGVAYVCDALAPLLDEPGLSERALALTERLVEVDPDTQQIDVLTGYAGAVPALLNLGRRHKRPALVDLGVRFGQRLLERARQGPAGWSWDTLHTPGQAQAQPQRDLLGFSHGTAGIAWSLLELYRATGQEQFRQGAEQALRYERHWFSAQQQNWPDFRNVHSVPGAAAAEPGFMVAWCHGAPGIGISRLRAYEILGDQRCREEAEIAARTTARMLEQSMAIRQGSFCLCHGLAGNADLLLQAGHTLDNPSYLALAEQVGRYGAERYYLSQAPWPCGVMDAGETPGLFLGLAGIGHFYLRLYEPRTIAPITIIAPDAA